MSNSASNAAAFYREVALNRVMWTVRDEQGFPAPVGESGKRAQPFWSSRVRAERVISSVPTYASFHAHEVSWEAFKERWAPGLAADGLLIGVNWAGARATGFDVEPIDVVRNVEALSASPE
jgi:hypothetical protein